MKVHILNKKNSIFNNYLAEIRNVDVQHDRLRFRRNLERMGEYIAYQISEHLLYAPTEITTPLGIATENTIAEQPVISSVLRAGLPLHNGILNVFDKADNAFISAYRKHHKDGSFEIEVEYVSSPNLENRVLIMADPMLATGNSMILSFNGLKKYGNPKHTHIAVVIASQEGLELAKKSLPQNCTLWVGAVDDDMTAQAYIVPGLGDAGDLAFGKKD